MTHRHPQTQLDRIERATRLTLNLAIGLTYSGAHIMAALDDLETQVRANTDAEASAIALLVSLAAQFEAVKNDPAKIAALSLQLKNSADALGAAVVANTPAA